MPRQKISDAEKSGLIFKPRKLTKTQQTKADQQLASARKVSMSRQTEEQKLAASLLQLKFKLEDYLESKRFDTAKTFGHFLMNYLDITRRKRNQFASEIDIHETLLSQLINNHRSPSENVLIRLEIHSNNSIPASYWYRLVEKEREYYIQTDQSIRKREKKFVKNKIEVKL